MQIIKENLAFLALLLAGAALITFVFAPGFAGAQGADLRALILEPTNNAQLTVGQPTAFRGAASGGSGFYTYIWNFGDGTQGAGATFVKTYTSPGTRTVTLTVTDTGSRQASVQIIVHVSATPPPAPAVDLRVNGGNGPVTLPSPNTGATLSWTSQNTVSCSASGSWTGSRATSGSESTGALAVGTHIYTLTCTGPGGEAQDSVTVVVNPPGGDVTPPTRPEIISSSHAVGATSTESVVTMIWSESIDLESGLAGYSFAWDHEAQTNPDRVTETNATTTSKTLGDGRWFFHLVAVDNAGNVSTPTTHYGPIIIDRSAPPPEPPVISNLRVTDITSSSVIVRWTTNRAASSRVIYDTASHPDISGATPPNFGYAFSTPTTNTDPPVTEHAVTISGLSPSTTYYFRAISQ